MGCTTAFLVTKQFGFGDNNLRCYGGLEACNGWFASNMLPTGQRELRLQSSNRAGGLGKSGQGG